jgi:hypothetical protein
MKTLLIVTAVIESFTGLVFLILPSLLVSILLGLSVTGTVDLLLGRVAGAALLSLGIACWLARNDGKSRAVKGLVTAMLLYNIIATSLLAYAGLGAHLSGAGLWPAVLVHLVMAVWCSIVLLEVFASNN